jgi:hypothetical protein
MMEMSMSRHQHGGVSVEYLVVALFGAIVLFGSYEGGDSVVVLLSRSVADYIGSLTYIISMP